MADENSDKTNDKVARMNDLSLSSIYVAGIDFKATSAAFDYSSRRAQKGAQQVARPPRVQHFDNGMALIERNNESPEFISRELFGFKYLAGLIK